MRFSLSGRLNRHMSGCWFALSVNMVKLAIQIAGLTLTRSRVRSRLFRPHSCGACLESWGHRVFHRQIRRFLLPMHCILVARAKPALVSILRREALYVEIRLSPHKSDRPCIHDGAWHLSSRHAKNKARFMLP